MAEFSKLVITNKGQVLLAKMIAGSGNIEFTKISTSSTAYTDAQLEGLTSLSDEKQTSLISEVIRVNEVAIKVEAAFTNTELTDGYYMKALGLYAIDPDVGEILYAVTRETSGNCYMPAYNGITVSGAYVHLITTVGNAENVSLEVDQAAVATIGNIQDLQSQIDSIKSLDCIQSEPPDSDGNSQLYKVDANTGENINIFPKTLNSGGGENQFNYTITGSIFDYCPITEIYRYNNFGDYQGKITDNTFKTVMNGYYGIKIRRNINIKGIQFYIPNNTQSGDILTRSATFTVYSYSGDFIENQYIDTSQMTLLGILQLPNNPNIYYTPGNVYELNFDTPYDCDSLLIVTNQAGTISNLKINCKYNTYNVSDDNNLSLFNPVPNSNYLKKIWSTTYSPNLANNEVTDVEFNLTGVSTDWYGADIFPIVHVYCENSEARDAILTAGWNVVGKVDYNDPKSYNIKVRINPTNYGGYGVTIKVGLFKITI